MELWQTEWSQPSLNATLGRKPKLNVFNGEEHPCPRWQNHLHIESLIKRQEPSVQALDSQHRRNWLSIQTKTAGYTEQAISSASTMPIFRNTNIKQPNQNPEAFNESVASVPMAMSMMVDSMVNMMQNNLQCNSSNSNLSQSKNQ